MEYTFTSESSFANNKIKMPYFRPIDFTNFKDCNTTTHTKFLHTPPNRCSSQGPAGTRYLRIQSYLTYDILSPYLA